MQDKWVVYIKCIVHPKNKKIGHHLRALKLFPEWFSFFCWTQKIFWRMSATKQLMTSIFFLPLKSMGSIDWLPILQNVFFCVSFVFSRRKKFIQVWNDLWVSKWWHNFGGENGLINTSATTNWDMNYCLFILKMQNVSLITLVTLQTSDLEQSF